MKRVINRKMINTIYNNKHISNLSYTSAGHFIQFWDMGSEKLFIAFQLNFDFQKDANENVNFSPYRCDLPWNDSMYDYSLTDWMIMLVLFMEKVDISDKIDHSLGLRWLVSHKINRKPYDNYSTKLQNAYDKVISCSPKWTKMFGNKKIYFGKDLATDNDIAMLFDTNQWMYQYFKNTGLELEDRQNNPACMYNCGKYKGKQIRIVRDHNGKIYKNKLVYLKSRVRAAYLIAIKSEKFVISKKLIFKIHFKYVYKKLTLHYNTDLGSVQSLWDQFLYLGNHQDSILPRRRKKLKYLENKMKIQNRDKCNACGKVEYYFTQEISNNDKTNFVSKLWYCKCKKLIVCSKKCQKYAWSRLGHRTVCSKYIEI
eukprot:317858_1